MADNVAVTAGSGTTIATDEVSGVHHQRVKLSLGSDGVAVDAVAGAGAVGNGVQRVTLASDDPAVTSLQVMDDWDESDRCKVNPIAGQAGVAGGSGAVSATTQRVVLATDVGLPAGTNYIGQVAGPIQYVDVTFTTPTDALDSGDVVAATQVIAAATRANDVPAILESVTLIDVDDQKADITIVLFDANTAIGTEDAAPDLSDSDVLTVLGVVPIASGDYFDLGGASVVTKNNLDIMVKPASGTDDIYAGIYLHGSDTPTYASGTIKVRFGFRS